MTRRLLEKLKLKRRAAGQAAQVAPQAPAQPVPVQPPQAQPAQAPPVHVAGGAHRHAPAAAAPPAVQPAPAPQRAGWTAAQKPPVDPTRAAQPAPTTRVRAHVQAAADQFASRLAAAMPEIQRAKQFALTVDGRRIVAEREAPTEPLTGESANLASTLLNKHKELDAQSRTIRERVEEEDFARADEALATALEIARNMLGHEEAFYRALERANVKGARDLAGQPSPAAKAYQEELLVARTSVENVLAEVATNRAVWREQLALAMQFDKAIAKAQSGDYEVATDRLRSLQQNAQVVAMLAAAAGKYDARRAAFETHLALIRAIDSQSSLGGQRAAVLKAVRQADHEAERGQFAEAARLLSTAEQAAQALVPADEAAARAYAQSRPKVTAAANRALAIALPCQEVRRAQQDLRECLDAAVQAAGQRNYDAALEALNRAALLTSYVGTAARRFEVFSEQEQAARSLLRAVQSLRPTLPDQAQQQRQIAAAREQATALALDGQFDRAEQALAETVAAGQSLLAACGTPAMAEYYREEAACRRELDAAAAIRSSYPLIQQAQGSLAEALRDREAAVKNGDFEGARFLLSIAQTRAAEAERLHGQAQAYDQARQSLASTLAAAQQIDASLPGVSALQTRLAQELAAARAAEASDFGGALASLQAAAKTARHILSLAERKQKQAERHQSLQEVLELVRRTYLPAGMADQLASAADRGLFDAFRAALRAAEQDKSDARLDVLAQAAQAYLDSLGGLSEEQLRDPRIQRRREACETALKQARHLKLANRGAALGPPPWTQQQEDQAADLYMQVLFETGELPMESPGSTSYDAKWVMSMDFAAGRGKRDFIFKPAMPPLGADEPYTIPCFVRGSEPAREVLGDELNRRLKAQTGLDCNVPETRLVTVAGRKLGDKYGDRPVPGSAQAAAPTIGSLAELLTVGNADALKRIPAQAVQKAAIFDALALNLDRHAGNFLVTPPGPDGTSDLVPIDNGLAFPTRAGLESRRSFLANNSAFMDIPAASEKFAPEMLAVIAALDAEEIIAGLRARRDSLARQHPELPVADAISDESLGLIRRSVAFLKRAAPRLSPAQLMEALLEHAGEIFDSPDSDRDRNFDLIIEESVAREKPLAQLQALSRAQQKALFTTLYQQGWNLGMDSPSIGQGGLQWNLWARRNPQVALTLAARKQPNPECLRQTRALVDKIKRLEPQNNIEARLAGLSPIAAYEEARQVAAVVETRDRERKLVEQFGKLFPGQVLPPENPHRSAALQAFAAFWKYGGQHIKEVDGRRIDKLPWPDRYLAVQDRAGLEYEDRLLAAMLDSPPFHEMTAAFRRYGVEHVDFRSRVKSVDDCRALLETWEQIKLLGGLKAYSDCGGNAEALYAGNLHMVLELIRAYRSLEGQQL